MARPLLLLAFQDKRPVDIVCDADLDVIIVDYGDMDETLNAEDARKVADLTPQLHAATPHAQLIKKISQHQKDLNRELKQKVQEEEFDV